MQFTEVLDLSLVPDEVGALGRLQQHVLKQLLPIFVYSIEVLDFDHECIQVIHCFNEICNSLVALALCDERLSTAFSVR